MANGATIDIVGNLTRDPELRFTPSGAQVATFAVAVNRRWRNQQSNEWDEQVSYFDIECWRDLAENVCESLTKGSRVMVSGRLEQQSWTTEQGDKRSKFVVVADEVGPSLRWATAEVTKVERSGGPGGGGGRSGGYDAPPPRDTPPAYNENEEPF